MFVDSLSQIQQYKIRVAVVAKDEGIIINKVMPKSVMTENSMRVTVESNYIQRNTDLFSKLQIQVQKRYHKKLKLE